MHDATENRQGGINHQKTKSRNNSLSTCRLVNQSSTLNLYYNIIASKALMEKPKKLTMNVNIMLYSLIEIYPSPP